MEMIDFLSILGKVKHDKNNSTGKYILLFIKYFIEKVFIKNLIMNKMKIKLFRFLIEFVYFQYVDYFYNN